MKKFAVISFCLVLMSFGLPAYAGSISLVPSASSVQVGQTISFQVIANGEGDPIVVSQFQLSYPQNLLTPTSFTFAPGWTQTFDPGTNVMASGTVVQAGGYTATFEGSRVMGTLTFTAQKTGEATLALSKNNTYMFEGDSGGNQFDGPLVTAQVDVTPAANGATLLAPPTQSQPPASPTASASQSPTIGSFWAPAVYVALGIVLLLLVWLFFTFRRRKSKRKRKNW